MRMKPSSASHGGQLATITIAAIGVVYGDIGTSPLYAMRECLVAAMPSSPTHDNVLGILSLIFWSLIICDFDQIHHFRDARR